MIVYWELTNACGLACRHCRATAMPLPAPGELTTAEAIDLLDDMTGFGDPLPHVVFTGGDPLRRPDLDLLLAEARARGIGASLAPAVTPLLTIDRLAELKDAGVQAISLSLDGSSAEAHDGVRGVPGTFEATLEALEWANRLDLPVQINTLVTASTAPDLPAVYDLLTTRTILRWSSPRPSIPARPGPVLPDQHRTRHATDRGVRRRGGAADRVVERPGPRRAVPGEDHRGDAVPPDRGPGRPPPGAHRR